MPLKIIGAGFGRTGTYSLKFALEKLGFPTYHMFELEKNQDQDFWWNVAKAGPGTKHNWEKIYANYSATIDNPSCTVWRELLEAYPDAKIILTLHPKGPEGWYTSVINTIYLNSHLWHARVVSLVNPRFRKLVKFQKKLFWDRTLKGTINDPALAIARYKEWIEEVKASVPAEKLLVFSVDQEWEPLCNFLGVPIPSEPFPKLNDKEMFMKRINRMKRTAYMIIAGALIALSGIIYGLVKVL